MGCECSQVPDEEGEIRNSNIEKSSQKAKEPEFFNSNTDMDATSPRVNVFTPAQTANPNATGTPLFFCSRNSNNGEIINISRDTGAPANRKQINRNQSASIYQGWQSIQIGEKLFQVREGTAQGCRWVDQQGFRTTQETPMSSYRSDFAICSMQEEKFVFVAGGLNETGILNSVDRFNIQAKKWETMPQMNIARQGAGSCSMKGEVYVFCGVTNNYVILNSVEKLTNAGGINGQVPHWQLINVAETMLIPRWNPAVCVLNSNEIVVMGGLTMIDDEVSCLGDVVLFNVATGDMEKRVQNFKGLVQF